jgi:RNA polymerase sigma factor (sigma-70 family)
MPDGEGEEFTAFFADAEPRLRRSLVAAYGPERGREATAEALSYAWEHWERVRDMGNPVGYLYRVGQSKTRPRRLPLVFPPPRTADAAVVEPGLPAALGELSERERQVVVLTEGFRLTFREVAELIDVSISSVQSYKERGLAKLRAAMGVSEGA